MQTGDRPRTQRLVLTARLKEGARERAVELVRGSSVFQSLCGPLAFRARLHAELGQTEDAAALVEELLDTWAETRAGYIEQWVLDAWFAAWSTGHEVRLQREIDESSVSVPWLEVATSLIRHDFAAAIGRLELMGASSAAAEARLWAGQWLVQCGRQAEVNVQLEAALAFWRSVGARRYLQRSESLLAAAS